MKRKLSFILVLLFLLTACTSCLQLPEPRPADFVEGDEIVIDNDTRFIYDTSVMLDSASILDVSAPAGNQLPYQNFTELYGNKIIRHRKTANGDIYYTVYAIENHQLLYLFLEPDASNVFYINAQLCDILDSRHAFVESVFEFDLPSAILDGMMPDFCYFDYYTTEEIMNQIEEKWSAYNRECSFMQIDTVPSDYWNHRLEIDWMIRCVQSVTSDINNAGDGLYCYDIYFYSDGTARLHYRHYISYEYPMYTLDQEEQVALTAEDVANLKTVFENADFENIPTWNPEEGNALLPSSDGETTYIWSAKNVYTPHLISMWSADPQYGIYKIRTAIEELARKKIEISSGQVYAD